MAQAAPGGVSNPVVWLRADDAGTISTAWKDNSPQARNVEAVGSWSLSAADRAHNFNPYTTGYTATRYFQDPNSFAPASVYTRNSLAAFVAVRRTGATSGRITGIDDNAAFADEPGFSVTSSGALRWYKFSGTTASFNSTQTLPLNRTAVAHFATNDPVKFVELDVNGDTSDTTYSGTMGTVGPYLNVGYGSWDGGGPFPGDIMEVIWYSKALSVIERNQIASYLSIKYGTSLGRNYRNSQGTIIWGATPNAGYNNNIAGIGRDSGSALLQKQSGSVNAGNQAILGVGSAIASTNALNTGSFATDLSYLLWGDNAGAESYTTAVLAGGNNYRRMARTWKMQSSGSLPDVTAAFPYSGTDNLFLIVGDNATFSGTNQAFAMSATQSIGGVAHRVTAAPASLTAGSFFTFATGPFQPVIGLTMSSTVAVAGSYIVPQTELIVSLVATNTGNSAADDPLFIVNSIPATQTFFNGTTSGFSDGRIDWSQTSSGLTFNATTDIAFSNQVTAPTAWAQCTYVPAPGYDDAVRHICIRPQGAFSSNAGSTFTLRFKARIK